MSDYDHTVDSVYTLRDCEAAVGLPAELRLTGLIIEAGESRSGPFVRFEVDERWGLGKHCRFVLDLDALTR